MGNRSRPFDWESEIIPRDPVPVDAIPDIGENQQSFSPMMAPPQDIEDQITYPLTTALLGSEVKTIRSYSMFGFSSIYIIFKDDAEFYWTRLESSKSSIAYHQAPCLKAPSSARPRCNRARPFWYTLEGISMRVSPPVAGSDELRARDWYVRYALQGVEQEVASIGGHAKEYQVDVILMLRTYGMHSRGI